MIKKRFISMLVLLAAVVSGAWATIPNSIVINGTPQVGDKSISLTYHFDPNNVPGLQAYAPTLKVKCAADNKSDEIWLSLSEVSSGTTSISLNNIGEFEAGKTYEVCFAYNNGNWVDEVFQSFVPAAPATTYSITVKEGTEDASSWTIAPAEATTTGVAAGTTVTATYSGAKKVKSVKAKKAAPAITVTWNNNDITGSGNSFTKDGVTITAGSIDFDDKNFLGGGTFTTTLGNFTKIEVTAGDCRATGTGWSGSTWTGNASSVSFSGDIMGQSNTKFVFTIEPTNAAASLIVNPVVGQIIGSDGKNYDANATLPDGVTKVAMIAYLGNGSDCTNGLAIQLNASPEKKNWNDAKTYASGFTAVPGGTWRLPSKADWQNMFVGCAKSGDAGASDDMDPIAGFKEKIVATGITWRSGDYWSSTDSGSDAWVVDVNLGNSNAFGYFYEVGTSTQCYVLGCLAF